MCRRTQRKGWLRLFTNCQEEVFSETQLPRGVILESVLMAKEKEPQRWVLLMFPPLEFLGFAGSA
jgi:hypothetical protein